MSQTLVSHESNVNHQIPGENDECNNTFTLIIIQAMFFNVLSYEVHSLWSLKNFYFDSCFCDLISRWIWKT